MPRVVATRDGSLLSVCGKHFLQLSEHEGAPLGAIQVYNAVVVAYLYCLFLHS